jgi:Domain of unknown function (DUF4160)
MCCPDGRGRSFHRNDGRITFNAVARQRAPERQKGGFLTAQVLLGSVMPTVLCINGVRVVIYSNGHPPAHVDVLGPGWVVVVNLVAPEVREATGCDEREGRRILRLIACHQETLMDA